MPTIILITVVPLNRRGRYRAMDFDNRAVPDAFSAAVIRAVLEFAPAAFECEEV